MKHRRLSIKFYPATKELEIEVFHNHETESSYTIGHHKVNEVNYKEVSE